MHILDIPAEISSQIFHHLRGSYLLQCALVCKSWNGPIIQLMYDHLMLEGYSLYRIKLIMKTNTNERDGYFKYGTLVKKITIVRDEKIHVKNYLPEDFNVDSLQDNDTEFDKDHFILLLEYFPNIQILDVGSSAHSSKYFQYMLDTESDKCLNQIQVISPDKYFRPYHPSDLFDTHFTLCYKYRATITNLSVNYKQIMMNLGSQHDKTLTFLNHFTRLTHLTLKNTCDDHLTTFDIQKICHHLTALEYESNKGIPDEIVKNILNDPASRNLHSNLKSLKLTVPTIPVNYARYITDCVSIQVDSLHLHLEDVYLYDWLDDIGMDNALKLVSRLSTVKNASFSCSSYETYRGNSISYESITTVFFKLLDVFKGSKNMFWHAKYNDYGSYKYAMHYSLKDGLHFDYTLGDADSYLKNEEEPENNHLYGIIDQEHLSSRVDEIRLPDTASSVIGPKAINCMDILMYDSYPEVTLKFLKYAMIHCPSLEWFQLQSRKIPHQQICIGTDICHFNKIRRNHQISSKSAQQNLKVIKTTIFIPTKEVLNLISTYLPNIEFFACGEPGHNPTTPKMAEIDFTAFKNLKTFYFDIQVMSGCETDHTFIHLRYNDRDEAYYCQRKTDPLVLNHTTLVCLQECNSNKILVTHSITIKCNKDVKVIVCYGRNSIIAEFDNGNLLDHIAIDSNFSRIFRRYY